jgi:hypothetical protein
MPNGHPNSIPELWIHIQADQKATHEHRVHLSQQLDGVNDRLTHIEKSVSDQYVRKEYFEAVFNPVRNIVYGMVGTTLIIVLTAIVYLVVNR